MPNYYVVRMKDVQWEYAKRGLLAVGWSEIDFTDILNDIDISNITKDKITELLEKHYGHRNGRDAGELYRFLSIKKGDKILVPTWGGFYICESLGEYVYSKADISQDRANQWRVKYALNENGEPAFFNRKDKNTALQTKMRTQWTVLQFGDEQTEAIVEIEKLYTGQSDYSLIDQVIEKEKNCKNVLKKELCSRLKDYNKTSLEAGGTGLEKLVKTLFEIDGYKAEIPPKNKTVDHADADIIATKESSISEALTQIIKIQIKHHNGQTGYWAVEQIVRVKEKDIKEELEANAYIALTSAEFNEDAIDLARKNGIILIDGKGLAEVIVNFFDDEKLEIIRRQLGVSKIYIPYTGVYEY